jgi:hypothetical protein
MPTFKTTITAPVFEIELPERHMRLTITDDGKIRIRQRERDILNGAPASGDTPRYAPPGEYQFTLPDAEDVNVICDTGGIPPTSPDFPAEGTFTITATHWHG